MRIAIMDDLVNERALLRNRLEQALNGRSVQTDICEYANGEAFIQAAEKQRFSAAFLDIYMPGANGIDTARALRASTDHALEGFQVRAMHYLVKPFTQKDIDSLTDEMLARIPQPDKYMDIKVSGSDIRLNYQSIVYAEHFSHMIHIHTPAKKTLITRLPFKSFIAPLCQDARFFVCGRGVIVNLEHAADFEDTAFIMDEGSRVFFSRELMKSARQAFMVFLLQRGH